MGIFRKMTSVGTMGIVSYRSNSERTARAGKQTAKYSKQARNAARVQVAQNQALIELQRQQVAAAEYGNGVNQAILEQSMMPARVPPPQLPPGWYADPSDARALCWWDGVAWHPRTKHFPQSVDPNPNPATQPRALP